MVRESRLHEIIAVEKTVKNTAENAVTAIHRNSKQVGRFNGMARTFTPLNDEGDVYPPESQKVQLSAARQVSELRDAFQELFNLTYAKDIGNMSAKADIVVEGEVLVEGVPATVLLFLEKKILDLRTFIQALPTLDPSETWKLEENSGLYTTETVKTVKTKKVQRPIVLHPPTKEHPAQTQLITEDQVVGHWNTTKRSAALTVSQQKQWYRRANTLLTAVKEARTQANQVRVIKDQTFAKKILGFVFDTTS